MLKFIPVFNAPAAIASTPQYAYLNEVYTDPRELKLGVVEIEQELSDVEAFNKKAVKAAEDCHGIALYLPHEDFGTVTDFRALPPIVKLFIEGVEVQLRRKVIWVGASGYHWLTVPIEVQDRYGSDDDPK